jgi:alpha-ribazole phosphatase
MKIYFMRHGQSEYNLTNKINCSSKVEANLTLKGKDQAQMAAEKLSDLRFDAIYVSEFTRTQETAAIIAKGRRIKIKVDKRLNELNTGFEGEDAEEYNEARKDSGDILNFKIAGKESFLELKKRVLNFLNDLKKTNHARILVVTHEPVVKAARAIFGELGDEASLLTPIKNAQYFMFDM